MAQKVKGSCTKGHKWEYNPMKIGDIQPTLQIANGKTWCLVCIEEAMVWLAIGEVE
jgi:alpha-tubulin suppressor-like RCC1 family protein